MSPDIATEGPRLTTGQAARRLGVSQGTVWSWITQGVKTRKGTVRLQASKLGTRFFIDPEALDAFEQACNDRPAPAPRPAKAALDDQSWEWLAKRLGWKE